jgi:hypothetical protein
MTGLSVMGALLCKELMADACASSILLRSPLAEMFHVEHFEFTVYALHHAGKSVRAALFEGAAHCSWSLSFVQCSTWNIRPHWNASTTVPRGTFWLWKVATEIRASTCNPRRNNSLVPAHESGIAITAISNYAALKSLVSPKN